MRVAIVGAGIAGNAAARLLSERYEVTVFESERRIGGHSATVDIDYDGKRIAVDTGFIVYNTLNYPNLTAMFDHLGVETQGSDMSFSVSIGNGEFEWVGRTHEVLNGLFAQRRNIVNPRYLGMLLEILRFQKSARNDLAAGRLAGLSLGDYILRERFSAYFRDRYIVPMGAAIWSTRPSGCSTSRLRTSSPSSRTTSSCTGSARSGAPSRGSRSYVEKLTAPIRDRYKLGTPVVAIVRDAFGVSVTTADGSSERFDHVVVAAHSDEALAMLSDPTEEERAILSAVGYRPNAVYLHRDPRLMPKRREAWAAWNFLRASDRSEGDVCVSYSMQHLQGIDPARPLFVTLNPPQPPREDLVFGVYNYSHPQYDAAAFAAQKRLRTVNGQNRTWFAGAWTGYGFHEDGLVSGMAAAEGLGATIPWRAADSVAAAE